MNKNFIEFAKSVWSDDCHESGQALIELAISLPLFLLMLLGAAKFAQLAYMAIEVSDAAKAAAQYGAQNETNAIDYTGIQSMARHNAPYVNANCASSPTALTASVQHQTSAPYLPCTCVASGTATPMPPTYAACTAACTGYVQQVLVVSTSASCSPLINVPGFSAAGITLRGNAIQEVLN